MKVLSADPHAAYLAYKDEIDAAVRRVLESGWYILGEEVEAFESEFASWLGCEHAVGVANGTDAVELALRAGGVAAGDGVVTVSNTAVATVAAIERCGAVPVLVDVDPRTFNMDPDRLQEALQGGAESAEVPIRAVVPVHLFGQPADMRRIVEIARQHDVLVVEDASQAHGARLHGRPVGTWGDVAAYSLYPTKNLGALGDAGVVVTRRDDLAASLRALRQYGWRQRYISEVTGVNSRLDPLQAAILRVKLRHLDDQNRTRRGLAAVYDEALADTTEIIPPLVVAGAQHVYHQYVVRVRARAGLQDHLSAAGVSTQVLYPLPIHRQPAYEPRFAGSELSVTEMLAGEILSLPVHGQLRPEQAEHVATEIGRWARAGAGSARG